MEQFKANYEFIGNITAFKVEKNKIIFSTDNRTIQITILNDKIFRLQMNKTSDFSTDYSWAVVKDNWSKTPFQVNEVENAVDISTSELQLRIEKAPFRLLVRHKDKIIWEDTEPAGIGWTDDEVIYFKKLPKDEHFFGFGEKTGKLDKRGYHYVMRTIEAVGYQAESDPLYQSHPFFIGINNGFCYGLFLDNTWETFFDMGKKSDNLYFFGAKNGDLNIYFMFGPSMKDVIASYTDLIGRIVLPPVWSLGFFQCKWGYKNQEIVTKVAHELRSRGIPADSIVLDIDYMDGYRVFTWNNKRFPDDNYFKKLTNDQGFRFVTIVDPGVKIDDKYFMYQEGMENNYFVKETDGKNWKGYVWPGATYFPDFTNPDVRAWWGSKLSTLLDRGITGIWNDMNEPSFNIQSPLRRVSTKNVIFYDNGLNTPFEKNRNVYGLLMARATHEGLLKLKPNERPWVLTRSGFSGIHRYAAVWTGDNTSNWLHLRMSIPMLLNMGLSSIPNTGADIGGFNFWITALRKIFIKLDKELIIRWHQLGAFYPFSRNHNVKFARPQEPWVFGKIVEDIIKKYLKLRYRWIPYLYNLFIECSKNGLPPMRPLILQYPDDDTCYQIDYEFMWGESILFAPVIKKNQKVQSVYLPEGVWINYWTAERFEGKQHIELPVDINDMPIFIKEGSIIPCQPDVSYYQEKDLNPLIIEIYPGNSINSSYTFQEDDGISMEYLKKKFCTTTFNVSSEKKLITFTIDKRTGDYNPKSRDLLLLFKTGKTGSKPKKIELNQQQLPESEEVEKNKWKFDSDLKTISIKIEDIAEKQVIRLHF